MAALAVFGLVALAALGASLATVEAAVPHRRLVPATTSLHRHELLPTFLGETLANAQRLLGAGRRIAHRLHGAAPRHQLGRVLFSRRHPGHDTCSPCHLARSALRVPVDLVGPNPHTPFELRHRRGGVTYETGSSGVDGSMFDGSLFDGSLFDGSLFDGSMTEAPRISATSSGDASRRVGQPSPLVPQRNSRS